MPKTRMEPLINEKEYFIEKVTIDNIPDLRDKTGEQFLNSLEEAVNDCRKFIAEGFSLTSYWADPDVGMEFILKKKKA
ncbi:hypothetical protein L9W92_14865 [Pelotomaculum terephthalicicum JT]|uniref:hypothetical protein n=1 Tax=Pelotomaculum terephthalicicum TaxID=206393 RepID=UPI0009D4C5E1|nr:hypothetical protein [Pelotomaculum terephthalicicum]MCG9969303.1 hypothetical protein [Pelotomaculum terephthalicicum JT]OPY62412.1 MAG: hypothetical protein A4E56_01327 [Pelotomaculum sp. PtaU1.Bin065]